MTPEGWPMFPEDDSEEAHAEEFSHRLELAREAFAKGADASVAYLLAEDQEEDQVLVRIVPTESMTSYPPNTYKVKRSALKPFGPPWLQVKA